MQTITATFEDGVLKPTQPLHLPAHARVRLTIEVLPSSPVTVGNLNDFLKGLPPLGDDAEDFARDLSNIRAEFALSWTMLHTHEDQGLGGPYFIRAKWIPG